MTLEEKIKNNLDDYDSIFDAVSDFIDIVTEDAKPAVGGSTEVYASSVPVTPPSPNVARFAEIAATMSTTYARKNADYGDSFGKSVDRYGPIAALTRMSDKWNRLENLMLNGGKMLVADEALTDTLIDLACYCVMTVIALEGKEGRQGIKWMELT